MNDQEILYAPIGSKEDDQTPPPDGYEWVTDSLGVRVLRQIVTEYYYEC